MPGDPASRQRAIEVRDKASARQVIAAQGFKGLNDDVVNTLPIAPDAINPTISPLDFIVPGGAAVKGATTIFSRPFTAKLRDVSWVRNMSRSQLQKKFDSHAKDFGISGKRNNKTLKEFQKALEDHVKSPDTRVIKGTYHKQPVTHYYNKNTGLNVMRNEKGEFWSGWKLSDKQIQYMNRNGKLGGN